jgi:hypothetical protein
MVGNKTTHSFYNKLIKRAIFLFFYMGISDLAPVFFYLLLHSATIKKKKTKLEQSLRDELVND